MPQQVAHTAQCKCTMGAAPAPLKILPANRVLCGTLPAATVNDIIPFMNVTPFGTCKSLANPITAALTAANLGRLTPGACIPLLAGPWSPGAPTVTINGMKALDNTSKGKCSFGGQVSIIFPAQIPTMIP